jgi:hypothetical protein
VFEHTINYRSAMIYGQPRLVTDPAEKLAGLRCITEAPDVVAAGGPKVASLAGQAGGGVQSARRRAVMLTPD